MLGKYSKLEKKIILTDNDKEHLYKTHYADVFRTIYYIIRDKEETKELVNETYIKAYNKIETLNDIINFKKWVCVIASNLAKNYIRDSKKVTYLHNIEDVIDEINLEDIVIDRLDKKEKILIIRKAISKLDEVSKEIVILRYYHSLTYKELSDFWILMRVQ